MHLKWLLSANDPRECSISLCSWLGRSSAQRPDVFEATLLASSFVISGHIGDSFLGRILPHLVVIGSLDCHGVSGESFLESQRHL